MRQTANTTVLDDLRTLGTPNLQEPSYVFEEGVGIHSVRGSVPDVRAKLFKVLGGINWWYAGAVMVSPKRRQAWKEALQDPKMTNIPLPLRQILLLLRSHGAGQLVTTTFIQQQI